MQRSSRELTILMLCLDEADILNLCVREAQDQLEGSGSDNDMGVLIAVTGAAGEPRELAGVLQWGTRLVPASIDVLTPSEALQ